MARVSSLKRLKVSQVMLVRLRRAALARLSRSSSVISLSPTGRAVILWTVPLLTPTVGFKKIELKRSKNSRGIEKIKGHYLDQSSVPAALACGDVAGQGLSEVGVSPLLSLQQFLSSRFVLRLAMLVPVSGVDEIV